MRVEVALLVLSAVLSGVVAGLGPLERAYKVLMVLPVTTKSHRNLFMALAQALADRGHEVVMLTNQAPSAKHPRITELTHGLKHFNVESLSVFSAMGDGQGGISIFEGVSEAMARDLYTVESVKDLYGRRDEFDVIVMDEMMNEAGAPFVHDRPYMTIAAQGINVCQSGIMGNVINPSYGASVLNVVPRPYSITDRAINLLEYTLFCWYWKEFGLVNVEKELRAHFPSLPPLREIEKNATLTLSNSHFSLDDAIPVLPSQVEVGGIHCRPAKPLPEDLDAWISGAQHGAIYFSLGTFARGVTLPEHYRKAFLEAFRRLDQRVVWKFEGEMEEEVPANVMLKKWLPQQDVLGHPNLRVFMSHGGLLSTQEAFYHGTPVLALPIFLDQPKNAAKIEQRGLGLSLTWDELTADTLVERIKELIENKKYQQTATEISKLLQDRPMTPQELAVYWTEYFIRHKGAPRLTSPAKSLTWREFFMLDVFAIIGVVLYVVYRVVRFVIGSVVCRIFSGGKKKVD